MPPASLSFKTRGGGGGARGGRIQGPGPAAPPPVSAACCRPPVLLFFFFSPFVTDFFGLPLWALQCHLGTLPIRGADTRLCNPPPPPAQRPMGIPLCASTAINLWVMGVVSLGLSAGGPDTPTPGYRSDPEIDSSQTQVHQAHGRQLEQLGPNRTSDGVRARATPSSCNFFLLLACVWKKKSSRCVIF